MTPLKLYRPSNGSEGESFMTEWCYRCRRDTPNRPCRILTLTAAFGINDKEYPREWRYVDGRPVCTAFVEQGTPVVRSHKPGKDQQELF